MVKIFAVGKKFGTILKVSFIMDDDGSVMVCEDGEEIPEVDGIA